MTSCAILSRGVMRATSLSTCECGALEDWAALGVARSDAQVAITMTGKEGR